MRIIVEAKSIGADTPTAFAAICSELLGAIVALNRTLIRIGRVPHLYTSGVRYENEPDDHDSFVCAETVLERGYGDCAHLAAWRVAELQVAGEPAELRVKWAEWSPERGRPRAFHAEVRRADGSTEDPSKVLGMQGRYSHGF